METKEQEIRFDEFQKPDFEQWRDAAIKSLKGKPFDKLITKTYEGIELQPVYNAKDIDDIDFAQSYPGARPFARSSVASGYRKKYWDIAQEIDITEPGKFNNAALDGLQRGQNALRIEIDSPGQRGLHINYTEELNKALESIDKDSTSVYIDPGSYGLAFAALLDDYFSKSKLIKGAILCDPLSQAVKSGRFSASKIEKDIKALLNWSEKSSLRVLSVSSVPYFEGGADAASELAFAMATGVEYLKISVDSGFSINDAAKKILFNFSVGSEYFMEIAKFRAARILWQRITGEFCADEDSSKMFILAQTSTRNKSALDPYVNMLRATTEALAAILGGCDSLTVHNFDTGLRPHSEFSQRFARNLQLVLREEAHTTDTIDPAGGSWYIEKLTAQLAEKAWGIFREIEQKGGMAEALRQGFPQAQTKKTASARMKNLATRKDTLLGTNKYPNLQEKDIREPVYDVIEESDISDNQAGLPKVKLADYAIDKIAEHFKSGFGLKAVAKSIEDLFDYETIGCIDSFRAAAPFEQLRDRISQGGKEPKALLLCYGKLGDYKARADFSADFMHVGGINTEYSPAFYKIEDAAKYIMENEFPAVTLCSSDANYPDFVPQLARLIKRGKPLTKIILAGYPKEHIEEFKAAGVDDFIHVKADLLIVLGSLLEDMEINDTKGGK